MPFLTTQPIPDPEFGAKLIDRTDLDECTAMKPQPSLVQCGMTASYEARLVVTPAMRTALRTRRKAAGLSGVEAGARIGRAQTFISFLETGKTITIHPDLYRELLDAYADAITEQEAA